MEKSFSVAGVFSRTLIVSGIVLIAIALLTEGLHYPWGALFGYVPEESSLADPAPIALKGTDVNSIVKENSENGPLDSAGEPETEISILPGVKSDSDPLPVYVRLGIIKIPKLGVSEHILEGTGRQLLYAIGHVTGTADIGASGNCVLAGHRYGGFRHIDKLSAGDSLVLTVGENVYDYSVYDSFDVLPEETWVLSDLEEGEQALTLITCTPYLISTHRLIVRARLP